MLISNMRSNLTAEAIEAVMRLPGPQRPPKLLLKATCAWFASLSADLLGHCPLVRMKWVDFHSQQWAADDCSIQDDGTDGAEEGIQHH